MVVARAFSGAPVANDDYELKLVPGKLHGQVVYQPIFVMRCPEVERLLDPINMPHERAFDLLADSDAVYANEAATADPERLTAIRAGNVRAVRLATGYFHGFRFAPADGVIRFD